MLIDMTDEGAALERFYIEAAYEIQLNVTLVDLSGNPVTRSYIWPLPPGEMHYNCDPQPKTVTLAFVNRSANPLSLPLHRIFRFAQMFNELAEKLSLEVTDGLRHITSSFKLCICDIKVPYEDKGETASWAEFGIRWEATESL